MPGLAVVLAALAALAVLAASDAGCVKRSGESGLLLPNARIELGGAQDAQWELFDDAALDTGYVHCTTYYTGGLRVTARNAGGGSADGVSLFLRGMPPLVTDDVDYRPDATDLHRIVVQYDTDFSYEAGCVPDATPTACSHCTFDATTLQSESVDPWIFIQVQCTDLWPTDGSADHPATANAPWPRVDLDVQVTCILANEPG
jgi:hypothetical protein